MHLFRPTGRMNATALAALLERQDLDRVTLPAQALYGRLDRLAWQQVEGLSRLGEEFGTPSMSVPGVVARCIEDMLSGLHGTGAEASLMLYMLRGTLKVLVGVQPEYTNLLVSSLYGVFPGITLAGRETRVGTELRDAGMFTFTGQMNGIPTLKVATADPRRNGIFI